MADAHNTTASSDASAAPATGTDTPEEVLRKLMAEYGDQIYRFCLSIVRDRESAQDLLQQTFIKAYANLENFEGRSSARTWLYSIARNQCIDELRRSRRHLAVVEYRSDLPQTPAAPEHDVAGGFEDRHLNQALANCVDELRIDVRIALAMRFQHEHTFAEMARITGHSAKKLQAQVSRAFPVLRACLKRAGVEL